MSLLDKILGRSSASAEELEQIAKALGEGASKGVQKGKSWVHFESGTRAASAEELERITKALGEGAKMVQNRAGGLRIEVGNRAASPEELERIAKALGEGASGAPKVVQKTATWVLNRAASPEDVERIAKALGEGVSEQLEGITKALHESGWERVDSSDRQNIATAGIGEEPARREPWGWNEPRTSFLRDHARSLMLGAGAVVFAVLGLSKAAPEPGQLTEISGKLLQVEATAPPCWGVCPVNVTLEDVPGRYQVRGTAALFLSSMRNADPVVRIYAEKRRASGMPDGKAIETWGLSVGGKALVPLEEALSEGAFMRRTVFPVLAVLLAAWAVARFSRSPE